MKKKTLLSFWLLAPIALWGQSEDTNAIEIDLSDVVIVEDVPAPEAAVETTDVVVEIPDAPIEGASIDVDVEAPVIPEATEALPSDTEIVLELPGQEAAAPGEATLASEETISVDFPDEDVRTILRNVADLFELNLVIPDTLQGRTSIKLRNITWRQAFEVVLEPLGYTYVEDRNIIRIKSIEELTTEPVDTRVFVINYADAAAISQSIAPLVNAASGGQIQVDARSNALVVTERPSQMGRIQEILERLDKPNYQVMIESRFVEVSKDDLEDIGVDWAFVTDDESSFQPGFVDPTSFDFRDGAGFGGFELPTAPAASSGLLAVFAEEDFAATLNALQRNVHTKLVSNPTVVVMNNQEANFQVGEDYPIREFSINLETGQLETGEVEYRFVGIELKVTPSVNAEGMISLDVNPEVSARLADDVVVQEVGSGTITDQIFRTRKAETQVTIKDGYTIALGGLTEETESIGNDRVPLLGDLPLFGKLFQNNSSTVSNSNLIIFLTAKTLNPDGTTYREIIDPRALDAVGHTESQTPGYVVPQDDLQVLREAEEVRQASERKKLIQDVRNKTDRREFESKTWMEKLKLVDEPVD